MCIKPIESAYQLMAIDRSKVSSKKQPGLARVHVMLTPDVSSDLQLLADLYHDGNRSKMVRELVSKRIEPLLKRGVPARVHKRVHNDSHT